MENNGSMAATPRALQVLQRDFAEDEIGLRPQVWCPACRDKDKGGPQKACGMSKDARGSGGVDHVRAKCKLCGQNITAAHMHLSYVGHAHLTQRLNEADPRWTWRPARDVPDEVMLAAIATGNAELLKMVLSAYPPKIIEMEIPTSRGTATERVMWGELVIHDDVGNEIVMPGVGDAIGKAWGPNALKEMVGDLLRNAGMRRGAALNLWMGEERDRAKAENRASADEPSGYAARAGLFDDDAKPAAKPRPRKPAEAKPDAGANEAGINPEAQAAADLLWALACDGKPEADVAAAHEAARRNKLLGLHCLAPWDKTVKTTVVKVSGAARDKIRSDTDS